MKLAILTGGDGWHVRDLERAAHERGHTCERIDFRTLSAEIPGRMPTALEQADAVMVRTMPAGSLEQVIFRMDVLHVLAARGVMIVNPVRALETCIDKHLTTAKLSAAGLPVPRTITTQSADAALEAFHTLGGDVVVKPLFGSEGRGMVRVSDPELAWRVFHAIERTQAVLHLQEFIAHPGFDVRAFVINGTVCASMKRFAGDDWRTNVAQGAKAEAWELPATLHDMALCAAEAVGTLAAGIDLLPGPNGRWYVLEVNAVPGWRALTRTTGFDAARACVELMEL